MSAIPHSSSDKPSEKKMQKPEEKEIDEEKEKEIDEEKEIDGWEDDLDKLYDWRASHPAFMEKLRKKHFAGKKPLAFEYYKSVCASRGFDPEPESYQDRGRVIVSLNYKWNQDCKILAEEAACHALNRYNSTREKKIEFVELTRVITLVTPSEGQNYYYITFKAEEEEGISATQKTYETRAQISYGAIANICSFRPKPLK